jgi:uncharacterized protein YPO0396
MRGKMMKKLSKIRLINWHYFVDETINVKGSALLTGENSAGKSTVLDAIQLVLTTNSTNFNKAANDEGKRNLNGYIRCKTGNENKPYERSGNITSYVALEFYEESRDKYFVTGARLDSFDEHSSPKVQWYLVEDASIEEISFINELLKTPATLEEFKANDKRIPMIHTNTEARSRFCKRLGNLNLKFTEIIPKSLAFKPIKNVKEFINTYILEEKKVQVSTLRENVSLLKELQDLINEAKIKVEKLKKIIAQKDEINKIDNKIKVFNYLIFKAQVEEVMVQIEEKKNKINELNLKFEAANNEIDELDEKIKKDEMYIRDLERAIENDESKKLMDSLERNISDIKKELKALDSSVKKYKDELKKVNKILSDLEGKGIYPSDKEEVKKLLQGELSEEDYKREVILNLEKDLDQRYDSMLQEKLKDEESEKKLEKKINEVSVEIESLKSKKLIYPKNTSRLKALIQEDFERLGYNTEVRILCDLLEVTDSRWQNGVEGYLNSQRFNLIVEPKYYDEALIVYEKVKVRENIHSVGLINTQKLEKYESCREDSLAHLVTSKNNYAKKYVNMIMGEVTRCSTLDELKEHRIAITESCMMYKNHVARQINPEVYKVPFIGAEAYKIQLQLKEQELEELTVEINEVKKNKKEKEALLTTLKSRNINALLENLASEGKRCDKEKELEEEKEKLQKVDKASIIEKQFEIEEKRKTIKALKENRDNKVQSRGAINEALKETTRAIESLNEGFKLKEENLNSFEKTTVEVLSEGKEKYNQERNNRTPLQIKEIFENQLKGTEKYKFRSIDKLKDLQREYVMTFQSEFGLGLEEVVAYVIEYNKLVTSEIITYEEKINTARSNCEVEFREHFIAKLKENIDDARREFRGLNHALKGLYYGNDSYEFTLTYSKKYKDYYDMITDESNLISGFNLYTQSFEEKYKDQLQELYEKLLMEDEIGNRALEELTDYRTYLEYDIRIKRKDGSEALFSKVCREKSGGETQTPYYVAIAASFAQLYGDKDSVRIILFDEAFDKMDEDRIVSIMEFLNSLKFQLIIATPPQKMELIGDKVDSILLAIRDDKMSFIEEYSYVIEEEIEY